MNINRRDFIKTSSSVTAGSLLTLSPFAALPATAEANKIPAATGFKLLFLAPLWGFDGSLGAFCAASKKAGYDGVEVLWSQDKKFQENLFAALKKYDLEIGFLCRGDEINVQEQLKTFKKNVHDACTNPFQKPIYINCHSGRDHFSYADNKLFMDFTSAEEKITGVPIYHETHRGRSLYAANITRSFIETISDLKLTFDVSHWCNVHESLLEDQVETVTMALPRVEHIHSRIGHEEGPQISDPRAPEWAHTVNAHLAWWDKVIERKKLKGERMTIMTEFGPPTYMPTLPFTNMPVANQWDINVYMMEMLKKRYR